MKPRYYALLLALLCAAHLTGCKASQPRPTETPRPTRTAPAAPASDSTRAPLRIGKPPLLPRLTDALGISTPTGRERRQMRRDVAATVPRSIKVKDGAFAWGDYAKATHAAKKATLATDSATLQVATNAVAGRGNTATQTATTQQAKDWRAVLAGPVGSVLALAVAAGIVVILLRRKAAKTLL